MVVCCDWRFLGLLRVFLVIFWFCVAGLAEQQTKNSRPTALKTEVVLLPLLEWTIILSFNSIVIHNVGQKVCHLYFYDNFIKCRPILTTGRSNMAQRTSHTVVKCRKQSTSISVINKLWQSHCRIAFTTSVARHETDESRTSGRKNMTNAPEFQNWGPDPTLGVTFTGWIPWVGFPISVQQ